jgi:uncharacterized membrane protein
MDWYMIVLRILHIGAAVFWVGSSLLFFFIIQPAAKELGPAGAPFMGHVTGKKKLPVVILVAATVTVLAGLLLYWRTSGGFDPDWITSAPGLGFTTGALAAVVAWIIGLVVVRPAADRMGALGVAVQASGGPPSEEQAAEMQRIGSRLQAVGLLNSVLLIFATVAMATARYL